MRAPSFLIGLVASVLFMIGGAFISAAFAQSTTTTSPPAPGTATVQLVLVCGPASANAPPSSVCPNDANGNPQTPTVLQGYVMNSSDYSELQAAEAPFDASFGTICFGLGLGAVLAAYFLTLPAGILIRMIGMAR